MGSKCRGAQLSSLVSPIQGFQVEGDSESKAGDTLLIRTSCLLFCPHFQGAGRAKQHNSPGFGGDHR